jgi:hypothetical protein
MPPRLPGHAEAPANRGRRSGQFDRTHEPAMADFKAVDCGTQRLRLKKWFHYCFNCNDPEQAFTNLHPIQVPHRKFQRTRCMQERRKFGRTRVLKGAKIVLGNSSVIDCAVRNMTNAGARLQIANSIFPMV